nr:MAG TPA: hypothetical protein [Caudoviricetes sp.]
MSKVTKTYTSFYDVTLEKKKPLQLDIIAVLVRS